MKYCFSITKISQFLLFGHNPIIVYTESHTKQGGTG
jgi:hypothetical protein